MYLINFVCSMDYYTPGYLKIELNLNYQMKRNYKNFFYSSRKTF